jgi:hypothetical protein
MNDAVFHVVNPDAIFGPIPDSAQFLVERRILDVVEVQAANVVFARRTDMPIRLDQVPESLPDQNILMVVDEKFQLVAKVQRGIQAHSVTSFSAMSLTLQAVLVNSLLSICRRTGSYIVTASLRFVVDMAKYKRRLLFFY